PPGEAAKESNHDGLRTPHCGTGSLTGRERTARHLLLGLGPCRRGVRRSGSFRPHRPIRRRRGRIVAPTGVLAILASLLRNVLPQFAAAFTRFGRLLEALAFAVVGARQLSRTFAFRLPLPAGQRQLDLARNLACVLRVLRQQRHRDLEPRRRTWWCRLRWLREYQAGQRG